ncbi:MAG: hypothetical protein CMJ89_15490 [Planctomycetes bacterium]|jgi:hypothetical protein|nr:hypothetical protein [Planctomycetota bacterium]
MKIEFPLLLSLLALPLTAQESKAIFDAPVSLFSPYYHMGEVLDLNGDGHQDVIGWGLSTSDVLRKSYYGNGDGSFSSGSQGDTSGSFSADTVARIQKCDVNADGRDDYYLFIPATGNDVGLLDVYVSAVGGVHTRFDELSYGSNFGYLARHATIADFNGDGLGDRATLKPHVLTIDVAVPNGSGGYNITTNTIDSGTNVVDLLAFDYNGDGTQDLLVMKPAHFGIIEIFDGVPQPPILMPHDLPSSPKLVPGDIDGDGDEDIVFFSDSVYRVFRCHGPTNYTLEPLQAGGPAAKLADVDNDGDLDGICCGGGGAGNFRTAFNFPSTFMISLNDGTGNFEFPFTFPGAGSREIAGAADLDHDGDMDLIAGHCVYYARGPLTGSPNTPLVQGEQTPSTMHDYDQDGDEDIRPGIGSLSCNMGDGEFLDSTASMPSAPAGMWFVGPGLSGDWDGDGDPDLLVRRQSNTGHHGMQLLLNDGGGSYSDGGQASTENVMHDSFYVVLPENSIVYDLDGDGDQDLTTFFADMDFWSTSEMKTWMNDGQGHFVLASATTGTWPVSIGNLWGADGIADVLVVYQANRLRLHPGLGDGSFQATHVDSVYLGTPGKVHMVVADFDQDGDEDLLGSFRVSDIRNKAYFVPSTDGNLAFADREFLDDLHPDLVKDPHLNNSRVAIAGDINGDGLLDAVFNSPLLDSPAISIVLRKADNSGWKVPVHQVVYSALWPDVVDVPIGHLADIDGDGDADLITDEIWENMTNVTPSSGARRQSMGGVPDTHGLIPTLGATGPFRVGEDAQIRLTGAPGGATGQLFVRLIDVPAPLGARYRWNPLEAHEVVIPFTTSGVQGQRGAGTWSWDYVVPGQFFGCTLRYRIVIDDPNAPGNEVRANALTLRYGN